MHSSIEQFEADTSILGGLTALEIPLANPPRAGRTTKKVVANFLLDVQGNDALSFFNSGQAHQKLSCVSVNREVDNRLLLLYNYIRGINDANHFNVLRNNNQAFLF
ncbi:hypothetical protein HZC34_00075 [Candidatus Saganbacteria bacterium]|nr:hypothetical protein [Candidatus Saganbacteria bacterium]